MSEEKKLKIEKVDIADGGRYGKFVCEPLDRGYGITLGNSLRRIFAFILGWGSYHLYQN
mgnify:CR=1 FL=1